MLRAAALGVTALLALAVPASAARLVTHEVPSRHVDPAKVKLNPPPPNGVPMTRTLKVNVLLPDGFDERSPRRWPLLVLLHGHGDTYQHWADPERGHALQILDGLPAIVVMPEGGTGWYTDWWNGGRRGDPGWEAYYLSELLPWIESSFPIRPERRWHAIAGLSMGGQGAAYFAAQRPGYFGSLAVFSAPLSLQRPEWPAAMDTQGERHLDVFGDPDEQRFYWTGHNPTALVDNLRHTRVYVSVGDGLPVRGEVSNLFGALAEAELRQHGEDFVRTARGTGIDVTYAPHSGVHDWPYWRDDLANARKWDFFAETVPDAASEWTFSTAREDSQAWDVSLELAAAPETLVTLTRRGDTLSATGSGQGLIRTAEGGRLEVTLPFQGQRLPPVIAHDVRRLLRTAARRANRRTRVPVLLPSHLRTAAEKLFPIAQVGSRGYGLEVATRPGCDEYECRLARFTGERSRKAQTSLGVDVHLTRGRRGRFHQGGVAAGVLSSVTWRERGVNYGIHSHGDRDSLVSLANSAIRSRR